MDRQCLPCSPANLTGILEELVALIVYTTSKMAFSTKAQLASVTLC